MPEFLMLTKLLLGQVLRSTDPLLAEFLYSASRHMYIVAELHDTLAAIMK